MSLALEDKIMEEAGFGENFMRYEGGPNCRSIRETAAAKIPELIQKYHTEDPSQIEAPYQPLMETLKNISEVSYIGRTVESTWHAASEIIQKHIICVGLPAQDQLESYRFLDAWLKEEYLSGKESGPDFRVEMY